MQNKHRSEMLDEFLDQEVMIQFADGKISQGVLFWNDKLLKAPNYLYNAGYYLRLTGASGYLHFKKSAVKKIKKI